LANVENLYRREYFRSSNVEKKMLAPPRNFEVLQPLHGNIHELRRLEHA
jgi:hypothetical protein